MQIKQKIYPFFYNYYHHHRKKNTTDLFLDFDLKNYLTI